MAAMANELATLRALSFRISSTATAQLPQHVPAIAASLSTCRTLLSSTQTSNAKTSSEASVAVHKFRTLLSTLLQDRTIQGRWSAIVLVKATIEVGGWETLQNSLPWVRGLLNILTKPDPPTSKKLCLITLTRIFMLTRDYPTLIRNITTPSLPGLVQNGVQIANSNASAGLLLTVLECFSELLPRHPTIFRPHLKNLRPLLCRLAAPTPSTSILKDDAPVAVTTEVSDVARRLLVQLPCCAAKGASSEEWENALRTTIGGVHRVADRVFRAVLEDWQSTVREASSNGHVLEGEVQDLEDDYLTLPPWSGIFAGSERLVGLLQLVKQYLESSTANSVTLRVGIIMDLITRLLSITIPSSGSKSFQNTVRLNNQVSKEERENLWLVLPAVHVATIELLLAMMNRLQSSTIAIDTMVLDQLVWIFGSERDNVQVRTSCYLAIAALLERSGMTLPKSSIDSLVPLMRTCCDDLLPSETPTSVVKDTPGQAKSKGNSQPQGTANADSFLGTKAVADPTAGYTGLKDAAFELLPRLLSDVRAQYFADSLRARLDRTAVLSQHKDAMLASVLNPPPSKRFGKPAASILPLMARSFQGDKDIEGMLRPRLPVIRLGTQDAELQEEDEEEDDVMEEDEGTDDSARENGAFVGQELDSLLETAGQTDVVMRDSAAKEALPSNATNAQEPSGDALTDDSAQPETTSKRPLTADTPLSPAKRVRFGETEYSAPTSMPPAANTAIPPIENSKPAEVPATSDFTVTSTASAIPDLPAPGEDGDDSDDDDDDDGDVIPLVFGQDSDDDSD